MVQQQPIFSSNQFPRQYRVKILWVIFEAGPETIAKMFSGRPVGWRTTLPHQGWGTASGGSCSQDSEAPPPQPPLSGAQEALPRICIPSPEASSWMPPYWDRSQLRNCSGASAKTSFLGGPEHFSPLRPSIQSFPTMSLSPLLPTIPPKIAHLRIVTLSCLDSCLYYHNKWIKSYLFSIWLIVFINNLDIRQPSLTIIITCSPVSSVTWGG